MSELNMYKASFRLSKPVNDVENAVNFFLTNDMTRALHSAIMSGFGDLSSSGLKCSMINRINWFMRDNVNGVVYLKANKELDERQLEAIAEFVDAQNENGIGERFNRDLSSKTKINRIKSNSIKFNKVKFNKV